MVVGTRASVIAVTTMSKWSSKSSLVIISLLPLWRNTGLFDAFLMFINRVKSSSNESSLALSGLIDEPKSSKVKTLGSLSVFEGPDPLPLISAVAILDFKNMSILCCN